jgi:hypothetical protein
MFGSCCRWQILRKRGPNPFTPWLASNAGNSWAFVVPCILRLRGCYFRFVASSLPHLVVLSEASTISTGCGR